MSLQNLPSMSVVLKDIYKIYTLESQAVQVLNGINLTIEHGSLISIVGRSGAGKSTLLHILGLLDRPSSGKIFLAGVDITTLKDHEAAHFRNCTIGFVFQMNNLLNDFSALENVMIPGLIAGSPKSIVKERALDVLNSVGLFDRKQHRPGELSGGEQQRIAIARAILMSPPLLLADEPTGNLDQKTSFAIQDLLLDLCSKNNMTMLLVTHDLELARRLPEQIVMTDGQITKRGLI